MSYCDPFTAGWPAQPILRNFWDGEPLISEMLDDPIVGLAMASDGVRPEDIEQLIANLRCCLNGDDRLSRNN